MSASRDLIICPLCGLRQQLAPIELHQELRCHRCDYTLIRSRHRPAWICTALALAALALYPAANLYPIMRMEYLWGLQETTIWRGVLQLYQDGAIATALIVFLASIVVPLFKIVGLAWLGWLTRNPPRTNAANRLYFFVEWIGRWSMLDVFLLAIMVALIKFGSYGTVLPGIGAICFAAVVILTMLASAYFDPQWLWHRQEEQ